MLICIAADHGGFAFKNQLARALRAQDHEVIDFAAVHLDPSDDYPDFVIPLALAVASGDIERGIAICGSGLGAAIAANKVAVVRAAVIHERNGSFTMTDSAGRGNAHRYRIPI